MATDDEEDRQGGVLIGVVDEVWLFVAPVDAVSADVSLAIAGMFTRELGGTGPTGGLDHLDKALGGAMTRLRSDGIFGAALGETLILSAPAAPIRADHVLAVGLGDPLHWSESQLEQAVAVAATAALRLQAKSVAFAPSLLDSGLPSSLDAASAALMRGLLSVLAVAPRHSFSRWTFCTGPRHFKDAARAFQIAFDQVVADREGFL